MKKQLKKITDLTVNQLLNNEVIMPSIYFEEFSKNAQTLEIDVNDKDFKNEIEKIIIEDFNTIEEYMTTIIASATEISNALNNSKDAILNKDVKTLTSVYKQMQSMEKKIKYLTNKLFVDELTNTYNKKWIYSKYLNEEACFKNDGICVLIDMVDYNYIQSEYGLLLSDNLLIFITNFISKKLKEEEYKFKISRFFDDKFLVFVENKTTKEINNLMKNIINLLLNTTLKSNSGLIIKATYNYELLAFSKNMNSKEILEDLFLKINK